MSPRPATTRWLGNEHRQGEIGYVFHPDHQGKGYATEAAPRCSSWVSRRSGSIGSRRTATLGTARPRG